MSYVNYDLEAVEKTMRAIDEETFMGLMTAAATANEKIGYLAQQRFTEAQVLVQLEMLRLVNENRDAAFIGKTIGVFIGNAVANTVSASNDPALRLAHIDEVIRNALDAVCEGKANGVVCASRIIEGTVGGPSSTRLVPQPLSAFPMGL